MQTTLGETTVNVYTNVIYFSFDNCENAGKGIAPGEGEIAHDSFINLTGQPLALHCASLAEILHRHDQLRQVFEVALDMARTLDTGADPSQIKLF